MSATTAPKPVVHVIATRVANIASVLAALRRLGVRGELTDDAFVVRSSRAVLLPGVGSFGAGAVFLCDRGIAEALRDRIGQDRPTAAICLGMQLLARSSEEGPGEGLGVLPARVTRFPADVRTPQFGWNRVAPLESTRPLLADTPAGYAYFANSYRIDAIDDLRSDGFNVAISDHGGPFAAAISRGALLACQFHPELSGRWGEDILRRWLARADLVPNAIAPPATLVRVPEVDTFDARSTLARRIVPCLDVRDGRVVKGVRFQGLRDAGDPVEQAVAYQQQGADELVMLDVSATTEGRLAAIETVAAIREQLSIPLTVGGGVRSPEYAGRLLDAGADKVSINTAAVHDPELIDALAARLGRQCVVLAIDAAQRTDGADGWQVVTSSGTTRHDLDVRDWASEGVARGAGEILLTSWDRDGTRSGYDLALIHAVAGALRERCAIDAPIIASGGAASAEHFVEAFDAGADAVLAASIFHDGERTVGELKNEISSRSSHPLRRATPSTPAADTAINPGERA